MHLKLLYFAQNLQAVRSKHDSLQMQSLCFALQPIRILYNVDDLFLKRQFHKKVMQSGQPESVQYSVQREEK